MKIKDKSEKQRKMREWLIMYKEVNESNNVVDYLV